jgi:hypothetical protein
MSSPLLDPNWRFGKLLSQNAEGVRVASTSYLGMVSSKVRVIPNRFTKNWIHAPHRHASHVCCAVSLVTFIVPERVEGIRCSTMPRRSSVLCHSVYPSRQSHSAGAPPCAVQEHEKGRNRHRPNIHDCHHSIRTPSPRAYIIVPLESRFLPFLDDGQPVEGIILLGGAVDARISVKRGAITLNEAGETHSWHGPAGHPLPECSHPAL